MPEMICKLAGFEYPPGKAHALGARFEVEERDVQVLELTGRAELPGAAEPGRAEIAGEPEQYRTRDIPKAPRRRGRPSRAH